MTANSGNPPNTEPTPDSNPSTAADRSPEDLSILSEDASMPIAIVGIGFRGPGDASNVEKLWTMIIEGREAWSQIPSTRWNNSAFYHPDHARHGTINVKGGHFLGEDVSLFDAPFFNMTSDEAAAMDPQQRLLLEVTYEALENSGIPLSTIMGCQASCFVGSFNADYTDILLRDPDCVPMYQCTNSGQSRAMTANRISYFFDLKGPSVTVDTACSGSLVALHLACQSLRTGDASMALAAGVNIILSHEFMSTMTMMKFLSPDGRCRTFDEKADGYARGEGIGCLLLKPLHDAIRDRDNIRAVIRGSGSNQDGRTSGITLPNGISQESLIRQVYQRAGLDPLETEFVEAHGTGTQAGDPIETGALARVFGQNRSPEQRLRVGSVKTNVGHLEGTSGIAGVIKAALMLERRMFLPNRNLETLNSRIPSRDWNIQVQLHQEPWESSGPHRVSVNSFGYGGSNAHVILEDAQGYLSQRGLSDMGDPARPSFGKSEVASRNVPRSRIFMISAFDEIAIINQIQRFRDFLSNKSPDIVDDWMNNLAFTLNERRTAHLYRTAIVANSITRMVDLLSTKMNIYKAPRKPIVGFVFTGQGAQWSGMGKELLEAYPVFKQSMERIDAYMTQLGAAFRIIDEILEPEETSQLAHPLRSQPICSALQIALVDLLSSWGIHPDSVTGHSSGEIAAAYAAGALSMEEAMAVAYFRGLSASRLLVIDGPPKGAMLAVGMSATDIEPYINTIKSGRATVACINSPSSVTVSGDLSAIEDLEGLIRDNQIFSRRLVVDVAYHSHHMESVGSEYLALIAHINAREGGDNASQSSPIPFFSSVAGKEIALSDLGPQYWVKNLLGQVKFLDAIESLCFETGSSRNTGGTTRRTKRPRAVKKVIVDYLIEIGPHSALSGPIKQIIKANDKLRSANITYNSLVARKKDSVTTALEVAANLACTGYPIMFEEINGPTRALEPRLLHELPSYPWNHTRSYWAESRVSKTFRNREFPRTDVLGVSDNFSCPLEPQWRNFIRVSEIPWLRDHKIQSNIVYPAAGYIVMAIEAAARLPSGPHITGQPGSFILRDVSILSALVLQETSAVEIIISLKQGLGQDRRLDRFNIYSVTADNRWTEHCNGSVGFQPLNKNAEANFEEVDNPELLPHSNFSILNIKHFYQDLASIGLEYGPCFANISQAHFTDRVCLAEIRVPDTAAIMPMNFQYPCIIHPCTLDTIIHSIFVGSDPTEGPAVPVHIQEMVVARQFPTDPGRRIDARTTTTARKGKYTLSTISAASEGDFSLSITGLRCKFIGRDALGATGAQIKRLAYNINWTPDPILLSKQTLLDLIVDSNISDCVDLELYKQYEACALHYLQATIEELGQAGTTNLRPSRRRTLDILTQIAGIDPQTQLLSASDHAMVTEAARSSGPEGKLLCAIGDLLPKILRTEPEASNTSHEIQAWREYCKSLQSHPIYNSVIKYLKMMSFKNPMMSILEVEAGQGDSSSIFLGALTDEHNKIPKCGRYTITDPSAEGFELAAQRLSIWKEWIHFEKFDVEGDMKSQGIEKDIYDLVLIPCGLYTVKSVPNALKNLSSLLRPGGHLVMVNPIPKMPDLSRAIISSGSSEARQEVLGNVNSLSVAFEEAQFSMLENAFEFRQGFPLIASKPLQGHGISFKRCLIVAEDVECGVCIPSLKKFLDSGNIITELTNLNGADVDGNFCIVLSGLATPVFSQMDEHTMGVLKSIFQTSAGILWVTRGGLMTPSDPNANLATGFIRTARSESGVDPIISFDLDGKSPLDPTDAARIIYDIFQRRVMASDPLNADTEYSERDGIVLIPRVVEDISSNEFLASLQDPFSRSDEHFHQHDRSLGAVIDHCTEPLQIHFKSSKQAGDIPDKFIRIVVHAVGFNQVDFRDSSDSLTEGKCIGSGWSGTVESIGKSVQGFAPGDRIASLGLEKISSLYQARHTAFQKLPPEISFGDAATLPIIHCAAFYMVYRLAQLKQTDKIFIYSAGGKIGQAVATICQHAAADVFATVETIEEAVALEGLLPPHRILVKQNASFPKDFKRIASEEIMDVIINCHDTGDRANHDLWKLVGVSSRVIQICDTTSPHKGHWEIPNARAGVTFATFSLGALLNLDPLILDEIWLSVWALIRENKLQILPSFPTYRISQISQVLRNLELKTDLEFISLTAESEDLVKTIYPKQPKSLFRPDVSYILVGGLGGIGRATALWMADRGAKTLIFISRSGLSRESSKETATELESRGLNIIVRALDISDNQQVASMMAELTNTAPPIRGIIQAAMVLKDTHIAKMTLEDYHSVLQPKLNGTWNLHNHAPKDLDWFIMLSSISGIIGNATQAAYAAGSTFMDAFAAYRNSLGLQAVSLDLGVITDVGYLAENTELAAKMAEQGFQGTDTKTLMTLIELAMSIPPGELASSQIITGLGSWKAGNSLPNFDAPLFAQYRRLFQTSLEIAESGSGLSTLREDLKDVKSLDDAAGLICAALSVKIADHLSVPVDNISPANPITEYGIDSHVAVELRNWISKNMESTVPILEILATGSLTELATRIAEKSALVKVEQ